jgi:OmpA-OmpF porin, OOP family
VTCPRPGWARKEVQAAEKSQDEGLPGKSFGLRGLTAEKLRFEMHQDAERREPMKPSTGVLRVLPSMVVLVLLSFLVGCAGFESVPKRDARFMFYPKELAAAERAVETARQAGKDRECPDEFRAAEKMKNDAFATYDSCHTKEGIAMAIEATNMANALCPRKAAAPPPPPPAALPPPPPPSVTLSANPAAILPGQCSSLTWSSTNATGVSIAPEVGSVDLNGSRQICPATTTDYTITAIGTGGSRTAAATVTVNPPPPTPAAAPPPPAPSAAPKVIDRLTIHVNFDFDKSVIRKSDMAELQKAVDFIKKYPGYQVSIEGHTDSIGTDKYNQALSERRAAAVKAYLLKQGVVDSQRIKSVGYGESRPVASNKTKEGRFENRRVEILILSE